MVGKEGGSALIIHHRDLSTPFGTTAPYCVADKMSDSRPVHVVCRKMSAERTNSEQNAILHAINAGSVPIVSALLFHVIALIYSPVVAVKYRVDAVYCFQLCIVQGWVSSRISNSRFVIGLDSVPVRQRQDFLSCSSHDASFQDVLVDGLKFPYFKVVGGLLKRSSEVIPLTEGIAKKTEEIYNVDLSECQALGMGVDVEKFSPHSLATDGGSDPWTMTYIGTIAEIRNLEQVIEAVAETDYDIKFYIAGQGNEEHIKELVAKSTQLGIDEQVEWLGLISYEEIPNLLAKTDLSVSPLPGIESFQISFPAKLLEYMAAESIVIATEIDPHQRLIRHGKNGFLYDGTREGLKETIEECIESVEEHSDIKRRAGGTAQSYDWDVVVKKYEDRIFHSPDPVERESILEKPSIAEVDHREDRSLEDPISR